MLLSSFYRFELRPTMHDSWAQNLFGFSFTCASALITNIYPPAGSKVYKDYKP